MNISKESVKAEAGGTALEITIYRDSSIYVIEITNACGEVVLDIAAPWKFPIGLTTILHKICITKPEYLAKEGSKIPESVYDKDLILADVRELGIGFAIPDSLILEAKNWRLDVIVSEVYGTAQHQLPKFVPMKPNPAYLDLIKQIKIAREIAMKLRVRL